MSVETHRVLMGSCGWNHQGWINDFYSDDLPEDWYLGFYSNEFSVVYVANVDWVDEDDLSSWTEDVSETFRFIFEVSAAVLQDETLFAQSLEKLKVMGDSCLAVVLQFPPSICGEISLLKQCIETAQINNHVCVDVKEELTDEIKDLLIDNKVSVVWDGTSPVDESFKYGTLALTHIHGQNVEMKSLRGVIESCLTASNNEHISVLCFDGEPPSLELLRNADIILNLL